MHAVWEGVRFMVTYGWDVSHFDAPDTRPALAEGIRFFTHKAGGDRDDAELAAWWNYMSPYRSQVLLGAYWVLYPGTPATRADAFLDRLDSQCAGWRDGPFVLQADCEIWMGDTSTLPSRAEIRAFCDRLVQRAPKLRPIVYAPHWAYGDTLTGLGYPLWASSYVAGTGPPHTLYPGDASTRWAAYSGQVPAILQFTSTATIGGQTTSDANAFRGTLDELTALVAPGWSTGMEWTDRPWSSPDPATAAIAIQRTYGNTVNILSTLNAFMTAEQQRDAAESAQLASLIKVVQTLASSSGALTPEQVQQLIDQTKVAAADAAAAAVARVESELESLRHHLGDDQAIPPATGRAAVHPTGLPVYDEADAATRLARERRQRELGDHRP